MLSTGGCKYYSVFLIFKDIIKRIKLRGKEQHMELVSSRCRSETGTGTHELRDPGRDFSLSDSTSSPGPPSKGGCEDYRRYYTG